MELNKMLIQGLSEASTLAEDRTKGLEWPPEKFIEYSRQSARKILKGCKQFENEIRDDELSHEDDRRYEANETLKE